MAHDRQVEPGNRLAKQNSVLKRTEQPSLLDSVLAMNLDQAAQVYKTEILPGEIRVWKTTFSQERPEAINWAFRQYFKAGTYPPKPADITGLIRTNRESPYFDGWDADTRTTIRVTERDRAQAKQSREDYFKSPEYQQFLERMKTHGM